MPARIHEFDWTAPSPPPSHTVHSFRAHSPSSWLSFTCFSLTDLMAFAACNFDPPSWSFHDMKKINNNIILDRKGGGTPTMIRWWSMSNPAFRPSVLCAATARSLGTNPTNNPHHCVLPAPDWICGWWFPLASAGPGFRYSEPARSFPKPVTIDEQLAFTFTSVPKHHPRPDYWLNPSQGRIETLS